LSRHERELDCRRFCGAENGL